MRIFKDLSWFFKKSWKEYLFGVGSLILISILSIIPPRILGYVIDLINDKSLNVKTLLYLMAVILILSIIMYALRYIWRIFILGSSLRLQKELRQSLFDHFTKMSSNFFQKYRVGDLMAHATNDLKSIERVAGFGVLQLADSISLGISVFVSMLLIDVKLALFILIPTPFLLFGSQILSKQIHRTFSTAQAAFSEMNNRMHENVSGIKVTKTFGQEQEVIAAFSEEIESVYKKNMNVIKYDAAFDPLIVLIIVCSFAILFIIGGQQIDRGLLTIGELVAFVNYMYMLIWPMLALGFLFNTVERGNVSYKRIKVLLNTPAEIIDHDKVKEETIFKDLKINIINFKYKEAKTSALKNINVELKEKQTLGIVGKTGSGKSTIIKLILREYDNFEGFINLNDQDIKDYALNNYHNFFGYVPQDQFLFSLSVADNIRFGKKDATLEEVIEAAKMACVHDDIIGFEHGYETVVGERGVSLSGGQKQRISIARALLLNPKILILDDALSAVDAKTETRILDSLRTTRQNNSTIIIAHRLSAIKEAKEIIVLDQGEIKERGNHEELITNDGWYANIYRQQELYGVEEGE
ncbi:MAG: ABC transporter ATP-binding protein [Anaerorhabdus sp.]